MARREVEEALAHPIDEEEEELSYTVVVVHATTGLSGSGTHSNELVALIKAKDDLLDKLEQAGGG